MRIRAAVNGVVLARAPMDLADSCNVANAIAVMQDVAEALKRICPDGLDVVYEGVGGDLRKTILPFLKPDGRMLCVGYISQYPHANQHQNGTASGSTHANGQPAPAGSSDNGSLLAAMPPDHELMWQGKTVEHGQQRVYGSVWPKVSLCLPSDFCAIVA